MKLLEIDLESPSQAAFRLLKNPNRTYSPLPLASMLSWVSSLLIRQCCFYNTTK
jgi:hypothetical protein